MNPSTLEKLEGLSERLEELSSLLADASVIADQERFRRFSKEHAELTPVVGCFQHYNEVRDNINGTDIGTVTITQSGITATTRFHFAVDRPGPPVLMESQLGDRVVTRMVLTDDTRGQ